METPAFSIGTAQARDLQQIVEVERASFGDPWTAASFVALLREPAAFFAVARDNSLDLVAGYVVAWFVADEGEIGNLAVREPTRRHGIGAALLDAALAESQRRGAGAVYLEVRDSNVAARTLYAGRRFVEVGRRRNYYGRPTEDAIVLCKSNVEMAG